MTNFYLFNNASISAAPIRLDKVCDVKTSGKPFCKNVGLPLKVVHRDVRHETNNWLRVFIEIGLGPELHSLKILETERQRSEDF